MLLPQVNSDKEESDLVAEATMAILTELATSTTRYGTFKSTHEGAGVLMEEVDEMWDAIKANDIASARKEAIQVAAMAMRFVIDASREDKRA